MIANNYIQCDGTVGHNDRHGVCILDKFCCKGFSVRNLCPDGGICCYGTPDCALDSSTNAIKQSYNPCPLIIPRQQWRARQPNQLIASIPPAEHVFVHHTDDGNTCQSLESCGVRLRSLQSYHQFNKDWPDIAWNFIIGGNGQVYEGVGWNRQGFHTLNWNHNSIGVAFVGNFNDEKPTEKKLPVQDNICMTI
ncbi:peptidoglycan-recognition protein 2-like [Oppia nitens]|uniref:peptidoglycan-recognition protein 2-like n=1 Tax=Oppia nitens TaxID=1686743 RepID=UPI0023DC7668|nr:peptidoglycan-recognition protein 2-like [Oppia nitens]